MSYRVQIESFEGPFDLLLALVSEQKVDIGRISISDVADQYLQHVEAMRDLDMDVASDFLVVAASLLSLKAASLLPDNSMDIEEEFEEYSPEEARDILVARLLAYKQFKNVAGSLGSRLESEGRMHARQAGLESAFVGLLPDYLDGVTLHSLAVICADLAARREVFLLEAEHIASRPLPVDIRMNEIISCLERTGQLGFSQFLSGDHNPSHVVVSFLAILELYHRGMVNLDQQQSTDDIEISYISPEQWAPALDISSNDSTPVDEYIESLEQ
ncbi:MAG: segregation/condensation protein A [Coriobacteriales bacterium]|jgi:segregation and condensation protein A|nr:segregation/condensation protein A [Coriobacteriales bacterium]